MGLAAILIALPFLAAAITTMVWIGRRLPVGWRRNLNVAAAACVLFPLAFAGWQVTIFSLTRADYVCVECGRTEEQLRFAGWTLSRTVRDDGEEYGRRFVASRREHPHDWHLESCLFSWGMVSCTMEYLGGWFRVLPKLTDRAAADQLVREAQALPPDQRARLMDEFTTFVGHGGVDAGGVDAAFESWRAQRAAADRRK